MENFSPHQETCDNMTSIKDLQSLLKDHCRP